MPGSFTSMPLETHQHRPRQRPGVTMPLVRLIGCERTAMTGRSMGGREFTRGQIYKILANPTYGHLEQSRFSAGFGRTTGRFGPRKCRRAS